MQDGSGRSPGMLYKHEFLLTDQQRLVLGTDRWFTVAEVAAHLDVSPQTIHNAIKRGSLVAFKVQGLTRVKGWRVLMWRDKLAGISDSPETDHQQV